MLNTVIKEIKEFFFDKKIWIGILTVLIIIIIGTSYNIKNKDEEASELLRLGVINKDDSSYSELLLSYFDNSETFSSMINVAIGEEGEIKDAFRKGDLDIYIEIPEGFAKNMIQIEHLPINVVINIEDTTKAILFRNVLESYEKYISAVEANAVGLYEIMEQDGMDRTLINKTNTTISLELIFTALGKEEFFDFQEVTTFPATNLGEYYLISILVMALLYAGLYTGFRVLREIHQGTYERLMTTQTPLYQFLGAKLLLQSGLLAVFAVLAIGIIKGNSLHPAIVYGIVTAMFSVTFSLFLSAFFKTTQRFILVGNLLIFYFAVIGGGIIPIMFLPQNILLLSKATPFYYIMEGMIRLNQGEQSNSMQIAMILLLAASLLFVGTLLFFGRRRVSHE